MKCLRITGTMHVFEDFACDRSSDINLVVILNQVISAITKNDQEPTAKQILSEFSGPDNIPNRIYM